MTTPAPNLQEHTGAPAAYTFHFHGHLSEPEIQRFLTVWSAFTGTTYQLEHLTNKHILYEAFDGKLEGSITAIGR